MFFCLCPSRPLWFNLLNGVNERLLDAVKNHHANEHHHKHEGGGVAQACPGGVAGAEEARPEGLDDRGDGVDVHHPAPALRDAGDGDDDGCGVHPQGNAEGDQVAQVAVFGGERGDDDAEAQTQPSHQEDQQGQGECPEGEGDVRAAEEEIQVKAQEEYKLDGEGDQVGDDGGDGHHQAREVDLAEQSGVGDEGVGGAGETVGEVTPQDIAGHVEQELGQSVGGQLGDVAEDDGEDNGGEQRLDQEPEGAEDGLLVARDEVTPHEEGDQVAVAPDIRKLQVVPFFAGSDDEVPIFGFSILIHVYILID